MYQKVLEGNFTFFDSKISKFLEFHYVEPGVYPSITDIVEAMNTLIQKSHNQSESCILVEVSRKKQKVETYFANEKFGVGFCITDKGRFLGSIVGNEHGVMLRGKRHQN